MSALLTVRGASKSFRGLKAVNNASFDVPQGRIIGLIGPNGAGKTTMFNLVAGVFAPDAGTIHFDGKLLNGMRPDQVCKAGIGRTFQIVKPFPQLSVLDNVIVGALNGHATVPAARTRAREVLAQMHLDAKAEHLAASLTLPERKRLEVARALATNPRLLLLDEVMAGLRPTEVDDMVAVFRRLNAEAGLTILLIEHVMRAVMALAEHVVVLNYGEKICEGTPAEVVRDPKVLECYLGEEVEV